MNPLAPDGGEAQVLALLKRREPVPRIADSTTWPAAAIRKLAARHGLLIDEQGVACAPDAAFHRERVERVAEVTVEESLRMAQSCPATRVQAGAAAVENAVRVLRDRLTAHETQVAEKLAAAEARDAAEAAIQRLEKELETARARLRDATATLGRRRSAAQRPSAQKKQSPRYKPGVDYQTSEARAWAKTNGYSADLPAAGRYVPDHVIEAMRTAQAAADAVPHADQRAVA